MGDSRWAWLTESRLGWVGGGLAAAGTTVATLRIKFAKARREDVKALIDTLAEVRRDSAALRVEIVNLRAEIGLLRKQNHEQAVEMEQLARNHRECDEKYRTLEMKVAGLESRG